MCDPILVTLLKMRPHYSQSSGENATPSSDTSPVASYKEVPPLPRVDSIENWCITVLLQERMIYWLLLIGIKLCFVSNSKVWALLW